jgi:hypothetical protein
MTTPQGVDQLAEQRVKNALYVLDILKRAYVPKGTNDWRELNDAIEVLKGNPMLAALTEAPVQPASADGSLTLDAALAGVLDLFPGADKQALRCLGELLTKPSCPPAKPAVYVPHCHMDCDSGVQGEYRFEEWDEKPFNVSDPQHWECAALYAHPPSALSAVPASPVQPEPADPLAAHRGAGGGLFGTHAADPVGALMQLAYNWVHEPTFKRDNPHAAKLEAALRAALAHPSAPVQPPQAIEPTVRRLPLTEDQIKALWWQVEGVADRQPTKEWWQQFARAIEAECAKAWGVGITSEGTQTREADRG